MKSKKTAGIAALILSTSIWGSSFVLAKIALVELSVAHVVLYRFVLSAIVLLPFLLVSQHRPSRRDLPLFAAAGFMMAPVTLLLQFTGLALTTATSTALIIGTGAPLLALAAVIFERERLGRRGWLALAVSTVGVVFLVGGPGEESAWLGNLLVFVSMCVSVVWILIGKRLLARYPAFETTGWILVFGTAFQVPVSLAWAGWPPVTLSGPTWAALLGLGLGCTVVAYVAWNWGVAKVGVGTAGIYLNFEPMVGALLGVILLGDSLSKGVVIGGTLILAAAIRVSLPGVPRGESNTALASNSLECETAS